MQLTRPISEKRSDRHRCHYTHFPRLSKAGGVDSLAPKQDWLHKTRRATAPTNCLSSVPSEYCSIWWGGRGAASRATFGALTRSVFCFFPSTAIFAKRMARYDPAYLQYSLMFIASRQLPTYDITLMVTRALTYRESPLFKSTELPSYLQIRKCVIRFQNSYREFTTRLE